MKVLWLYDYIKKSKILIKSWTIGLTSDVPDKPIACTTYMLYLVYLHAVPFYHVNKVYQVYLIHLMYVMCVVYMYEYVLQHSY